MEVVPPLVDDLNFNSKDKSPLRYAIMLRAAELQGQKWSESGKST